MSRATNLLAMFEANDKQIYNTLTSQKFATWYEGPFLSHIRGDNDLDKKGMIEERNKIMKDIKDLFR
jgi:hypothetical protein